MAERTGIVAAGNWIVDHIKIVDVYPPEQALANIRREYTGNGGAPFNVLKDLSLLGARFPLMGYGLVGEDNDGRWIRDECRKHGIDTKGLQTTPDVHTSYTDVMSVDATGRRTFFHQRGANARFGAEHMDIRNSSARLFHLAYLLLLDEFDRLDANGVTVAANVLKAARDSGLKTSIDTVSEDSHRFTDIIFPSLPFVDFLFMNEYEASRCSGVDLCSDVPDRKSLREASEFLLQRGVHEWVFLHYPKGVYARSVGGTEIVQSAVRVPANAITSTVGAGDAFAAGTLWGIHENWDMKDSVRLGVCAAAACLGAATCSDGVRNYKECLALGNAWSYYDADAVPLNKEVA